MALSSRSIRRPSSEVVGAWQQQRYLVVAGSSTDNISVVAVAAANVFLTELLHAVQQTAPRRIREIKE